MDPKDVAPMLALVVVAVITATIVIVRQLLSHQRQMTEMLHRVNQQQAPSQESLKMQEDMFDLKQLVHQQAIAIDNLGDKLDSLSSSEDVSQRLNAGK